MNPRRPSRWLAPLALLGAVLAVFLVITSTTGSGDGDSEDTATTEQQDRRGTRTDRRTSTGERTETGTRTTATERRAYTIRPGDTLQVIAERTGVPVEEIQRLNPDVDPNNLPVGEKIKLTE